MSIKISDLTVSFKNGVTAINHVDLEIPNGIFGLLGENGAGKTTLMRVLTTVLKPTSGAVTLDGMIYSECNYPKIQKKIGYLPQELDLYPNLTVEECLEYMGELAGIEKKGCQQRIKYYLEKTSLTEHRRKKIRQLSGIRIRNLLVDFSENRTILFSTHVVEDLAATCNQLAVMKKGQFLYSGSMQELLNIAKGHVWICKVKDEFQARELEKMYHVSAKQYVDGGLQMKILCETQPDVPCIPCEITLEDAYIYISNNAKTK